MEKLDLIRLFQGYLRENICKKKMNFKIRFYNELFAAYVCTCIKKFKKIENLIQIFRIFYI